MNFSLLSTQFLLLAISAIILLTLSRGGLRQVIFLTINILFIWFLVLGGKGSLTTVLFSLLGYVLVKIHLKWESLKLIYTLPVFIGLFFYMKNYEILHLILPESFLTNVLSTIGLSFLLFKIIHVLVDAKGGVIRKLDIITYLNYCFNFTTFLMGPIQRYQDYYDQWNGDKQAIEMTFEAHLDAVLRILLGLVKAYLLAQWFYVIALKSNTNILDLDPGDFLIQIYGFFFYLYLNFSGYTDVVIGTGSLFGVRPPENFNKPFLAQNISDFWLRQHRSLSLWLTDYVFSPAYKNALNSKILSRHPLLAGNSAFMLTMLVSGIWHGTSIGFLIFGIVHGIYLIIYHTWTHILENHFGRKKTRQIRNSWFIKIPAILLTFNATSFAFLFFQLDTTHLNMLAKGIFS